MHFEKYFYILDSIKFNDNRFFWSHERFIVHNENVAVSHKIILVTKLNSILDIKDKI